MKYKVSALIVAGLICALAAGGGAFIYMSRAEAELRQSRAMMAAFSDLVDIPVAAAPIAAGEVLRPELLKGIRVPANLLPSNTLTQIIPPAEGEQIIALQDIAEGNMFSQDTFGRQGPERSDISLVEEGQVALPITVTNLASLSPHLSKGTLVSLYGRSTVVEGGAGNIALKGLRIVSLLTPQVTAAPTAPSANIIVSGPSDEIATLTNFQGNLTLALDGTAPPTFSSGPVVAPPNQVMVGGMDDFIPAGAAPTAPSGRGFSLPGSDPERPVCTTSVVRGAQRIIVEVPCK